MKLVFEYLAIGAPSFLAVIILEAVAVGLGGHLLRTGMYSIHDFCHFFFGVGLASIILFVKPRSSVRAVVLIVLVAGIAWELREGFWLAEEPIDSVEDLALAALSAFSFLCIVRKEDSESSA